VNVFNNLIKRKAWALYHCNAHLGARESDVISVEIADNEKAPFAMQIATLASLVCRFELK